MTQTLLEMLGNALVLAGAGLFAAAALGMLRMPDIYNRTNAVAKAAALAVSCVLAGVMLLQPSPSTIVILLLAIAAQLFTAPIAGYAVGRAAYRSGAPLAPHTHRDDLADRAARARRAARRQRGAGGGDTQPDGG